MPHLDLIIKAARSSILPCTRKESVRMRYFRPFFAWVNCFSLEEPILVQAPDFPHATDLTAFTVLVKPPFSQVPAPRFGAEFRNISLVSISVLSILAWAAILVGHQGERTADLMSEDPLSVSGKQ